MSLFQGQHHSAQPSPSIPNIQTSDYRPNYVVSMLLDKKNRLWIGTWGGGLSLLDTKTLTFRNFTVQDGLPGNFILSLEADKSGGLWIGTNNGLSRFDGKTFQNFSAINGLKSKFIFSIEAAPEHSLWIGANSSLTRLVLDPETGIPLNIN
jgi:streptogramin lyase